MRNKAEWPTSLDCTLKPLKTVTTAMQGCENLGLKIGADLGVVRVVRPNPLNWDHKRLIRFFFFFPDKKLLQKWFNRYAIFFLCLWTRNWGKKQKWHWRTVIGNKWYAAVLLAFIRRLHFYSFVEPLAVFILETYNASRRIMRLQII